MGILKNLLVTGAARFVNTIKGSITHAQNGMYYGTCSTAAGTAAKVVELVDPTGFELKPGVMIAVKFSATSTASSVTLNVEGTGAKQVWYAAAAYTSTSNTVNGIANRIHTYVYDGTYWVWMGHGSEDNSNTYPSAQCETAAATAAKAATCTNYTLTANTYLHFNIRYANTSQTALTMNVNSKGAKPIYINGFASSASNYTLPAGSYIAFYDGTNWYFRTDGKIPGRIETTPIGADCDTAGNVAAKTAVADGFVLNTDFYFPITIRYSNTSASALTLNVNNTGAKTIYINNVVTSSTNYTLPAGTYMVHYGTASDGSNLGYYFRTDGYMAGFSVGCLSIKKHLQNNATTTVEEYALDARMGKTLNDKIEALKTELSTLVKRVNYSYTVSSIPAQSSTSVTADDLGITVPNGYLPISIININLGSDLVYYRILQGTGTGTGVVLRLCNTNASALSNVSVSLSIIYVRSAYYES